MATLLERWFKGKDGRLWLESGWTGGGIVARDYCKNPIKATRIISRHAQTTARETTRRLNDGEKIEYER